MVVMSQTNSRVQQIPSPVWLPLEQKYIWHNNIIIIMPFPPLFGMQMYADKHSIWMRLVFLHFAQNKAEKLLYVFLHLNLVKPSPLLPPESLNLSMNVFCCCCCCCCSRSSGSSSICEGRPPPLSFEAAAVTAAAAVLEASAAWKNQEANYS